MKTDWTHFVWLFEPTSFGHTHSNTHKHNTNSPILLRCSMFISILWYTQTESEANSKSDFSSHSNSIKCHCVCVRLWPLEMSNDAWGNSQLGSLNSGVYFLVCEIFLFLWIIIIDAEMDARNFRIIQLCSYSILLDSLVKIRRFDLAHLWIDWCET